MLELTEQDGLIAIDQKALLSLWRDHLATDTDGFAQTEATNVFENTFLSLTGKATSSEELAFLRGGWTLNLKAGVVKTALAGAFMAGLFSLLGFDAINPAVLPSVLPFLFELESVNLSQKEALLLAELKVRPAVMKQLHSPAELYAVLPPSTQSQLNELDFADFLHQLDLSGWVAKKEGLSYQMAERQRFRVTLV
jgi:hypothetical protein